MTIQELTEKWQSISPFSGGFLLVSDDHPLAFHIGYENAHKCFMVLNTGKIERIVSSKAIHVDCVSLSSGGDALRFILYYPTLDELFIKLCWDLIDSSRHDKNPVQKIVLQYKSWLRLLQQAGNDLMSISSQKGLLAELLFLYDTVIKLGSEIALNAWTGPEGSDQDFNFCDHWTEIKAVKISADNVSISSLQQLDRIDTGEIVVYFMDRTDSSGSQTVSLPETIENIRHLLSSEALKDEFACKLAKNGYFDKDAGSYSSVRFRLAERRRYKVLDEFPRLTRANVPSGVVAAEYYLSLAVIDCFSY